MVTITIDGREICAGKGTMILDAARENNIYIPTLCTNEAVAPYGGCRLCLVEVTKKGRQRLVASCLYQVEEGLTIKTNSEKIKNIHRMIMELLLARCPNNKEIKELAKKLGVEVTRFKLEDNQCVLCSLCVRACQEVVGTSAISLVNRGINREVAIPFYDDSDACIACGSCAYICPTDAIKVEDIGDTRIITMPSCRMEFKLKQCKNCGIYWAPEKQIKYMAEKANLPLASLDLCPDCRD